METPAPHMYVLQARPTPLPFGSLRCLSFHPDISRTLRMHSSRPMVPTFSQLAVNELALTRFFSLNSAGSMFSFSAILSSCTSWPKRGCGVPCPRLGPHAGLLVNTRHASNLKRG